MIRRCCLAAPFAILLCGGCNSSAAGRSTTTTTPDAGAPDLVVVAATAEVAPNAGTSPDVWQAPDVVTVPDLAPAPDTSPAHLTEADAGIDTLAGIEGGRSDAREAGRDALAMVPDTRPALPKCAAPDFDECPYFAVGVQGCTLAAYVTMEVMDAGAPDGVRVYPLSYGDAGTTYHFDLPFRDACAAFCGLCAP